MTNEISPQFSNSDRSARDALERKRVDLERARTLSPSLVAPLEREIAASEKALEAAREAGRDYDRESHEFAVAEARRRAAQSVLGSSHEIDPKRAAEIVRDAEVAKYLEQARSRRVQAARDAASSAYGRVMKSPAGRDAAVNLALTLAGAVVDREQNRIPDERRPEIVAWARLTLPAEGRAAYLRSHAVRVHHPSYPVPPGVEEYDAACARFFAGVERARKQAADLARDLGAVVDAAE